MHCRRLYVPPGEHGGHAVALSAAEAHYARRVLRLRDGDEVAAFDGAGWTAQAVVRLRGGGAVGLEVLGERSEPAPRSGFSIAQALLKAPAMDLVVQEATELGAFSIAGFSAERSVPRPPESGLERWRRIAREACRQCGRAHAPEISYLPDAAALSHFLRLHGSVFVACLREGTPPLGALLDGGAARGSVRVLLVVGPEGDFAPGELEGIVSAGARPCRLAGPVLRAETAAAAGAALLADHFLRPADAE